MSEIILYGDPRSTYFRTARIAAEEKGVSYDMVAKDAAGLDYEGVHPFGKMPGLAHGDVTIYETAAIVCLMPTRLPACASCNFVTTPRT
jgi:glutathione S-transferase